MYKFTTEKLNALLSVNDYQNYFKKIVDKEIAEAPYDNPAYYSYTEANYKRRESLLNKIDINKKLYNELDETTAQWHWILISEPWCGDASFSQPIIETICLAGDIDLKIALRDTETALMDAFLTNGGKSIPKLVVLNKELDVLFSWGPRPQELQKEVLEFLKTAPSTEEKIKLAHRWYIQDKGEAIQHELLDLIKQAKK